VRRESKFEKNQFLSSSLHTLRSPLRKVLLFIVYGVPKGHEQLWRNLFCLANQRISS
jgi:hypothetical protein